MDWIVSVEFVSNPRNCLPFLEYPRTSLPDATKIFSFTTPGGPPSSSLVIFCPGRVLNEILKRENTPLKGYNKINFTHIHITFLSSKTHQYTIVISNGNLKSSK